MPRGAKSFCTFGAPSLIVDSYRSWVSFRLKCGRRTVCNKKSTIVMLNAGVVNAGPPIFFLPQFCESFCDSGRILRFKKSVKYIANSPLTLLQRRMTQILKVCQPYTRICSGFVPVSLQFRSRFKSFVTSRSYFNRTRKVPCGRQAGGGVSGPYVSMAARPEC